MENGKETKFISLDTVEKLKIYMSPVRQKLLRELSLCGLSMTAKDLSLKMNISASSVKHHLQKLEELGIVEVCDTKIINGITAKYYCQTDAVIKLGLENKGELREERKALGLDCVNNVIQGFINKMENLKLKDGEKMRDYGDMMNGFVYLTSQESKELTEMIDDYIKIHSKAKENTSPWEFSIIRYNASKEK